MEELVLIENPYYRTRSRKRGGKRMKNPLSAKTLKNEWFAGMDLVDVGAAAGGLVASSMIPSLFVKDAVTTWQKVGKIILALVSTAGAGFIARNISPSAGKAAVAGGIAGTVVQIIASFTSINLGFRQLNPGRRIGSSTVVSPAYTREQETVQLITP